MDLLSDISVSAKTVMAVVGVAVKPVLLIITTHLVINSPLMLIEKFLQALTSEDKDGRVVVARKGTEMTSASE